jgi:hypothetical protein
MMFTRNASPDDHNRSVGVVFIPDWDFRPWF